MSRALEEPITGTIGTERRTANRTMLVLAVIAALLIGNLPLLSWTLYPLRLFVTFIHETCHAIAAVSTGAHGATFTIDLGGGGLTHTEGGISLLIAGAGYLGAALLGAAMLVWGTRPARIRPALVVMALLAVTAAVIFARNILGVAVGLGTGLALYAVSRMRPIPMTFLYQFLAVQISLNAISDLMAAWFLNHQGVFTDAAAAGQITHTSPTLWIVNWMAASVAVTYFALRYVWTRK